MPEGCTAAVMGSSVHHPNAGFGGGFINDSYYRHHFHHDESFQQLQYLDQQQMLGHKVFYPPPPLLAPPLPPSPPPSSAMNTSAILQQTMISGKDVESNNYIIKRRGLDGRRRVETIAPHESSLEARGDAQQVFGVASPQILDHRSSIDAYHQQIGELGCVVLGATRRNSSSWAVHEAEQQQQQQGRFHRGDDNSNDLASIPRPPFTPIHDILSPPASPLASPAMPPSSPDCKVPEPRSVLDLTTSPRPSARSAAIPSGYEFELSSSRATNSPGAAPLLSTADDEFFADFQRRDSSSTAQLLGLDEDEDDSSQWEYPPAKSTVDWLQETSQLWMDSLIDDLTDTPVHSSCLPRLDEEDDAGDEEARTPSTSTPCPSELCHTSPSFDREHSDDQCEDEEESPSMNGGRGGAEAQIATTTIVKKVSSTLQQPSKESVKVPNRESDEELVSLLLGCAEAVSTKSLSLVNPLFAQLGEMASPEGTAMQRVAAYFTEGLAGRCIRLWPQVYRSLPHNLELSEDDALAAFHILNQVCPYVKFAHFTANDIILQAFEGCDRVHVIDLDIKQGLQWPALFQSLAARPGGPPEHIRVTGVGEYKEDVQDTGDRLAEFAEALDLPFEFHAVIDKLEDVRLWMLHVKEGEAVAVNCVLQLHRALQDSSESGIKDMLGLISSTKPRVVAIVEQEASHNGRFFEGHSPRFLEALQYYAALFDSLDLNMPPGSGARKKVEQFFAREIRNIVACEGSERTERHELLRTWRQLMERGGYKSVPLSQRARSQAELLLEMYACKSYTIAEHENALTLGWGGRSLYTASGWAPKLL